MAIDFIVHDSKKQKGSGRQLDIRKTLRPVNVLLGSFNAGARGTKDVIPQPRLFAVVARTFSTQDSVVQIMILENQLPANELEWPCCWVGEVHPCSGMAGGLDVQSRMAANEPRGKIESPDEEREQRDAEHVNEFLSSVRVCSECRIWMFRHVVLLVEAVERSFVHDPGQKGVRLWSDDKNTFGSCARAFETHLWYQ